MSRLISVTDMPAAAIDFRRALMELDPLRVWLPRDDLSKMWSTWMPGLRTICVDIGPCPEHAGFLASVSKYVRYAGPAADGPGVYIDAPRGYNGGEFHEARLRGLDYCPHVDVLNDGAFVGGWPADARTTRVCLMVTAVLLAAVPNLDLV